MGVGREADGAGAAAGVRGSRRQRVQELVSAGDAAGVKREHASAPSPQPYP